MTLLVGILCKDGVVMGSDSAATFGASGIHTIGQQEVPKVQCVNDFILMSATGAVGMSQLIADRLKTEWPGKLSKLSSPAKMMNAMGLEILGTVRPYLETAGQLRHLGEDPSTSVCKALVAVAAGKEPCLFQFAANGAPEHATPALPFVALGSGQLIADPFLALLKRVLWTSSEPTLAEGRLAAVWTIVHVNQTNPGGVGGHVQLATLAQVPGKGYVTSTVDRAEIDEHLQRVASAEQAFVKELRGLSTAASVPPPPAPPEDSAATVASHAVAMDGRETVNNAK